MSRFFFFFLAVSALALVIGQATTENPLQQEWQLADNSATSNGGVMIIETYSASSVPVPDDNTSDMQPLPGNPDVEVAPDNKPMTSSQPIAVEEDE